MPFSKLLSNVAQYSFKWKNIGYQTLKKYL